MKLKIRKGATVQVIAGAEKGKQGKVMAVDSVKMRIRVEGIKVMTHFDKKDGIQKREAFFDYSNVKLVSAASTGDKEKKKSAPKKKTSARKSA